MQFSDISVLGVSVFGRNGGSNKRAKSVVWEHFQVVVK